MPKIYIQIPKPVYFVDPKTKSELEGENNVMSFDDLLHKIMDNPKWNGSYKLTQAADGIMQALEEAKGDIMVLAGEDHEELKDAVENPRIMTILPNGQVQVQSGFGVHPRLARQLLPLLNAIMKASDKDPRNEPMAEPKAV